MKSLWRPNQQLFALSAVVLGVGVLIMIYLMTRISSLDEATLHAETRELRMAAHTAAEHHRAFFRERLWIAPALSCLLALMGWVKYALSPSSGRTRSAFLLGVGTSTLSLGMLVLGWSLFLMGMR